MTTIGRIAFGPQSFVLKPNNKGLISGLRPVDNSGDNLRVVTDYRGIMAEVVKAAKDQGVRFSVSDFQDGEIECLNDHIVIFRGNAAKLIDRIYKGTK